MNFRIGILILTLFMILGSVTDVDAQRRKKRKRPAKKKEMVDKRQKQEPSTFMDNITYDIKLGNLRLRELFFISAKLNAGYKIMDRFSAGLGTKIYYEYSFPNKEGIGAYGAFGYARFAVYEGIYLQAEYNTYSVPKAKYNQLFPAFGLGYAQSINQKWSYVIEGLYQHRASRSRNDSPFEYWIGFSYNF